MKHFRVFKKFAAIMANLSLVFNNLFPLLWLVQPVYANTPEDPVPTVIEEQLNQELNQEQEQENKSDSSDIQPPASTPAPEPTPTPEATATPEPTSTPEPTPTLKSTVTPEPTPVLEPSLTPAPTLTPAEVPENSDVGNITPDPEPTPSITPVVESTPTPAKICLTDQEIKPSSIDDWNFDEKTGIAETKDPVKLGVKYQFPGEDKMSVTFTCLPETTTSLKIERIKISDLKLPEGTTALGEYAYDVTTGMDNGSFEYDITLPKPEDKKVNVVYLEKSADEVKNQSNPIGTDEIKPIEENKLNQHVDSNNVEVKDLDHFTIYIVTNPTGPTLSTAMVNGMEYVSVPPSTSVTVTLKVTTSGSGDSNDWRTTQYSFNGVNWTCVNTPNHTSSGTWTEDFTLTAPDTIGSYDLHLRVYNGDNCTGGVSETVVLDDAIRVVTSLPSPTPPPLTNNPSDPVALTSVSGIWTSIDGGSGHQGIDTSEIRWGTAAESQKSGLRFTNSGNQSFDTGETFYLGMLTHMNWPVQHGTAANGATLQITLNFDRPDIDDVVLDYDFDIEETPNSAGQCKEYQRTLTACDDKVTFPNSYATRSFRIGDIQYTLVIDGFVDAYPSGNPVNAFITEEKKDNSAFLVGHLSSVLVERPEIRLTKKTNDQDVASAPGPNLYIGDTVEWKYIVQNSGNVALTNINLTDSDLGTINCPSTELAKGAIMTCTATGIVVEGQYMNTATVVGTPPTGSNVTASDSSWYYGVQKKGHIIVDKVTNPAGDSQSFSFTTTGDGYSSFSLTDAAEPNDQELVAGIYSVTETVPTGWHSASSCTSSIAGKTQDPSALNLANGETITCTFINSKLSINVIKTANPTSVPETGGNVEFTARVNNTSPVNVTLTSLNDDKFGDITVIEGSTCVVPQTIVPGGHYECKFTKNISGEAGQSHTNIITAIASGVFDTDDATVEFTDVAPTIEVTKTPSVTEVPETGANVTFTFVVKNTSTKESVTITSLTDSIYGTLNGDDDCKVGTVLAAGSSCEFSITKWIEGDASGNDHYNVFTGKAKDNDNTEATDDDDATVEFTDVAPTIEVTKTASTLILPVPGGNVTFTVVVTNKSKEAVTLTSLTDDIYGDLNGQGNCATGGTINPNGGTYTCSFSGSVTGDPGFYKDIVTAIATDNEGSTDTKTDDAVVELKGGKIIIEKQTLPDGYTTQSFEFDPSWSDVNFNLTDGQSKDSGWLAPGKYSVSEIVPTGWDLTNISCGNDTDSTVDITNKTANINVSANETVRCVFTNTKRGTVVIEKNAINDSDQSFRFTNNFGNNNPIEFSLTDDTTTGLPNFEAEVLPGQYIVTEDEYESWTLTEIKCVDPTKNSTTSLENRQASIDVAPGETVTCTFTNRQKPTLTVVKKVINDNGGTKTVDDFGITFSGGQLTFDKGVEDNKTTTYTSEKLTLDKGTYTLSEKDINGYTEGTWDCGTSNENKLTTTIKLNYNQNLICTITNDDQPGTLIVKKVVNNINGGDLTADDFSFSVNDGTAIPFEADGENSLTIDAGIYTVTETPVDGYQPSYNNCSNITLANGGTATCTITNDAIFGQISVIKFNDVNGNGQMDSDEETLPNWQINLTSQDSKITNDQGSAVFNKLIPQTYYLSETLQPGWTQTNIYCDDKTPSDISNQNNYQIELGSSQSLQCHIGNRLLTPELDIAKTNNVGSSVLSPGDSVTYTIKLEVSKNDISNLKVTDLLSNGFKYRPGSYKVIKNGIEDITSQIAEPQYHSPGLFGI